MDGATRFFNYAKERQSVLFKREAGKPWPWTGDFILQSYRFCNIFREDDAVTRWLAEHVRGSLGPTGEYAGPAPGTKLNELLLAVVIFRWFNRIETGDAIFRQKNIFGTTAWTQYRKSWDVRDLKVAIKAFVGEKGPYVTGSYIIQGWRGMNKLDGVLKCIENFQGQVFDHKGTARNWKQMTDYMLKHSGKVTLQEVWEWLCQVPYLGKFMAYEIVCDLYNTPLLQKAPDIMSWANPGPGARRGLNRIHGRPVKFKPKRADMLREMQELLAASTKRKNWKWPEHPWDMRTVEHTLCEFDKYERALNGQGRPRQVFKNRG